jgi:hypothetical protein
MSKVCTSKIMAELTMLEKQRNCLKDITNMRKAQNTA